MRFTQWRRQMEERYGSTVTFYYLGEKCRVVRDDDQQEIGYWYNKTEWKI